MSSYFTSTERSVDRPVNGARRTVQYSTVVHRSALIGILRGMSCLSVVANVDSLASHHDRRKIGRAYVVKSTHTRAHRTQRVLTLEPEDAARPQHASQMTRLTSPSVNSAPSVHACNQLFSMNASQQLAAKGVGTLSVRNRNQACSTSHAINVVDTPSRAMFKRGAWSSVSTEKRSCTVEGNNNEAHHHCSARFCRLFFTENLTLPSHFVMAVFFYLCP